MNKQFLSKTLSIVLAFSFGLSNSVMLMPFRVGAYSPPSSTTTTIPPKPDLIATKTNNLGGSNAIVGTPFNWIIKIENIGTATATFEKNEVIFQDNMPSNGVGPYGTVSVSASAGVTGVPGDLTCTQASTDNRDLTCRVINTSGKPLIFRQEII